MSTSLVKSTTQPFLMTISSTATPAWPIILTLFFSVAPKAVPKKHRFVFYMKTRLASNTIVFNKKNPYFPSRQTASNHVLYQHHFCFHKYVRIFVVVSWKERFIYFICFLKSLFGASQPNIHGPKQDIRSQIFLHNRRYTGSLSNAFSLYLYLLSF